MKTQFLWHQHKIDNQQHKRLVNRQNFKATHSHIQTTNSNHKKEPKQTIIPSRRTIKREAVQKLKRCGTYIAQKKTRTRRRRAEACEMDSGLKGYGLKIWGENGESLLGGAERQDDEESSAKKRKKMKNRDELSRLNIMGSQRENGQFFINYFNNNIIILYFKILF